MANGKLRGKADYIAVAKFNVIENKKLAVWSTSLFERGGPPSYLIVV